MTAVAGEAIPLPTVTGVPRTKGRERLWWFDTAQGLVVLFTAAFVLRLLIAPHLGFYGDERYFRIWASRLDDVGPRHFYARGYFVDYPPGYLYVLALIGKVQHSPSSTLLKLPIILGDLALAWLAATMAVRIAPARVRERLPVRPIVAAAVLFNPAVLAIGAAWGQVDVVPAALVMGVLVLLVTGRRSGGRDVAAMLLFAVAVAIKPQAGFLAPVLAYVLVRRYLLHPPAGQRRRRLRTLAVVTGSSVGLWSISGLAFGLGPKGLVDFYRRSADTYPVT